jgi:hypothetical protein
VCQLVVPIWNDLLASGKSYNQRNYQDHKKWLPKKVTTAPEITSPNALRDLLILMASFILSPCSIHTSITLEKKLPKQCLESRFTILHQYNVQSNISITILMCTLQTSQYFS